MTQEFVPYEHALALKELGFDEPCFGGYDMETLKLWIGYLNDGEQFNREYYYPAPTFSQAFRWFREKHKIGTWIHHYFNMDKGNFEYSFVITLPYKDDGYVYEKHEEAELTCLRKLIEIVKQNQIKKNIINL